MAKLRLPLALLLALTFAAAPAAAQKVPQSAIDAPSPLKPGDAFGEEATLPERTIIYVQGHSRWDLSLIHI